MGRRALIWVGALCALLAIAQAVRTKHSGAKVVPIFTHYDHVVSLWGHLRVFHLLRRIHVLKGKSCPGQDPKIMRYAYCKLFTAHSRSLVTLHVHHCMAAMHHMQALRDAIKAIAGDDKDSYGEEGSAILCLLACPIWPPCALLHV